MHETSALEQEKEFGSFESASKRSAAIWADLSVHPQKYRVLTGDRPTGSLHIGHYFGTLKNRVHIQSLGVESFIVVADYQVLTDRDTAEAIPDNVREIVLDYLAAGLDPDNGRTFIFCHSHVLGLNQLLLPFLTLVSISELERNPTVKDEIRAAGLNTVNASMFTYPVHQAADILFCKGNVVPVGRDQLPHLELTRKIARRFNDRFSPKQPVFPTPDGLLSDMPMVLGLDGEQKMSKSRNNSIMLKASADETAKLIKGAKTDSNRLITYEPDTRPGVANLLRIGAMCLGCSPEDLANQIGEGGGGKLKATVTEALNEHLAPIRDRRLHLAADPAVVRDVLTRGVQRASEEAEKTLREVRAAMNMDYKLG